MRDAFGGAFFIKLMLIFFAIYISFIAIALSYAKAFRIKNTIINYIEENEGYGIEVQDMIDDYVASTNYYVESVGPNGSNLKYKDGCNGRGYCVWEVYSDKVRGTYYKVTTFIEIQFPFFFKNGILVPISGETRVVGK